MTHDLHISLLGRPRVRDGGGRLLDPLGSKATALVACLALAPGLRMARADLARLLWSDAPSGAAARHALRQCLFRLRGQLGPVGAVLGADAETVWLDPARVETDVAHLAAVAHGPSDAAAAELSRRIEGSFCDGLELSDPEFEHWLRRTRAEIDATCAGLLARAARAFAERGEDDAAIDAARRRVALEPYEDAAHGALIACCVRAGRQHLARDAYAACVRTYREDLGIEPGLGLADALAPPAAAPPVPTPAAPNRPRRAPALIPPVAAALGLATLIAQVLVVVAPTSTPVQERTGGTLWVTPGDAAPRMGTNVTVSEHSEDRQGGANGPSTNAIRRMLEGERDYAMLYPAGC